MNNEFKRALEKVIKNWQRPIQKAANKIQKNRGTTLTEDQAFDLLKKAMVKASGKAFHKLKLAHTLMLDSPSD